MKNKTFCAIICPFFLIIVALGYWAWLCGHNLFDGYFGAGLGALGTLLVVFVAWWQLSIISGTSRADFIHRLKNDFFTKGTRILIHLIENKYIHYIDLRDEGCEQGSEDTEQDEENGGSEADKKESYFEVDLAKIDRCVPNEIGRQLKRRHFYSEYEIDDLVLGHFEDIGIFEQKRLIDMEMVYEEFSYYIIVVYENGAIKKYIESLRKKDADIYANFEYIYNKCKSFDEAKERKMKKEKRKPKVPS